MRFTLDVLITPSSHEPCTSVCSSKGQGAGAERIQKMSRNMRGQAPASVDTSEGVKSAKKKCDGETILHLGISAFPLAAFVHHSRRARTPPSSFSSFHCLRAFVLSYNSCSRPPGPSGRQQHGSRPYRAGRRFLNFPRNMEIRQRQSNLK